MTFIREIQALASDSTTSLPDLLRKTKILARRLQSPLLEDWVNHELNGYSESDELPPYRIIKTQSMGSFASAHGTLRSEINTDLLPDKPSWHEMATTVELFLPVAYYQHFLESPAADDNSLGSPWPMNAVTWAQHNIQFFAERWVLQSAWRVVTRSDFAALLDTIRTRILDFALDLEAENPSAGEEPVGNAPPIKLDRVTHIINNTIFSGDTRAVAVGNVSATQSIHYGVIPGDIESLHAALLGLGVREDELVALDDALNQNPTHGEQEGLGPATRAWIANAAGNLGSGAAEWAGGLAAGGIYRVLEEPIKAFLGLLGQ
jgi:hypothetical protein